MTYAHKKHYTPWDVKSIQQLVSLGASDETIAENLHRSPSAIRRYRYRHHPIKNFRWSDNEVPLLREKFENGESDKVIAKALGRNIRSIETKRLQLRLVKKGSRVNVLVAEDSEKPLITYNANARLCEDLQEKRGGE